MIRRWLMSLLVGCVPTGIVWLVQLTKYGDQLWPINFLMLPGTLIAGIPLDFISFPAIVVANVAFYASMTYLFLSLRNKKKEPKPSVTPNQQ